jgi:hypothetical protein
VKKLICIIVLFLSCTLNAQDISLPKAEFYITNSDDTVFVKNLYGRYLNPDFCTLQESVVVLNSKGGTDTFCPSEIKSFSFKTHWKWCRFDAVNFFGKKMFLYNCANGPYLKVYEETKFIGGKRGYISSYYLNYNGIWVSDIGNFKESFMSVIADDSLLTKVITKKKIPLEKLGLQAAVCDYNLWIAKKMEGRATDKDTSMVIKGIVDADKCFNRKRNFFLNFFANGLGPEVGLPTGLISALSKPRYLYIPDENLKTNNEYLIGYKARAAELKNKAALWGHICGWGLFFVVATIVNKL